jgi:hypothetical protein
MSDDLVIAKIRKGSASEVWITVTEYAGLSRLDVREHFRPSDGHDWLPTKKGVSIKAPQARQAVAAAEELAEVDGPGEVATVPISPKARLRFAVCEFNKRVYAEIRTYYREDATQDRWKPGKGVTFRLASAAEVARAIRVAEEHLRRI